MIRGRVMCAAVLVAASLGCKTSSEGRDGPEKTAVAAPPSTFELAARDLVEQLQGDLAVAVAYPAVAAKLDGARTRNGRHTRYPNTLLAALVRAKNAAGSKVRFLTREHLVLLLEEQGLQWSDLVPTDPKTRVKLKAITAVQAYVVWRIETGQEHYSETSNYGARSGPRGFEDWTLMVVSVQTGEILAATRLYRHWLPW